MLSTYQCVHSLDDSFYCSLFLNCFIAVNWVVHPLFLQSLLEVNTFQLPCAILIRRSDLCCKTILYVWVHAKWHFNKNRTRHIFFGKIPTITNKCDVNISFYQLWLNSKLCNLIKLCIKSTNIKIVCQKQVSIVEIPTSVVTKYCHAEMHKSESSQTVRLTLLSIRFAKIHWKTTVIDKFQVSLT